MRRTIFQRLPLLLLLLLLPFSLVAADEALLLSQGDYSSVSLYDPYGVKTDAMAMISEDGYIIKTTNTSAIFSSPFGDIKAEENTLLAVTGFNYNSPSLYLLDGEVQIKLDADIKLTIFTSTASYTAEGKGVYSFIYTESEDKAKVESGADLSVLDPLRGNKFALSSGDSVDMLTGKIERASEKPLLEGSLTFMGSSIDYTLYPSKAVLTYPTWITNSDVEGFFAYLLANESDLLEGVNYSFTNSGEVTIDYGTELDVETQKSLVSLFSSYLASYAASLYSTQAEEVKVEGRLVYGDYSLYYSLGAEKGILNYPSIVTNSDVEAFFAYLLANESDLLEGVTYSFTGANEVTIDYGTTLDSETLESLVELFASYIEKYLDSLLPRVPATPIFKGVSFRSVTLVSGTITYADYTLTYKMGPKKATINYPAIVLESDVEDFFAYIVAHESELTKGVTYEFTNANEVTIDYGTELDEETLRFLAKGFEDYLIRYLESLFKLPLVPASPLMKGVETVPSTILSGTIGYAGYELSYSLTNYKATLKYPSIVANSDVEAFFAYLAAEESALLKGVTYSFTADNEVTVDYGVELNKSELSYLVTLFREYLEKYLTSYFTPATPTFKDVVTEATNRVPKAPTFTIVKTTEIARVPAKPILKVTSSKTALVPQVLTNETSVSMSEEEAKKKLNN